MADKFNTLGFVSWGLLGYGEAVSGGDADLDIGITQSEGIGIGDTVVATKVTFKQAEAKTLTFTITEGGVAVDVSGATLTFGVKANKSDTAYIISKADGDFDKALAVSGIVTVALSAANLTQATGIYVGELKVQFAGGTIDKSADLTIVIEKAIIPV